MASGRQQSTRYRARLKLRNISEMAWVAESLVLNNQTVYKCFVGDKTDSSTTRQSERE